MIGDGWDGDPFVRPENAMESTPARRVAVVTGSRAEFGLLTPVMHAVAAHPSLELLVIAAGSHLVPPAMTFREVKECFGVADSVPMQKPGDRTRADDVQSVGRGVARFGRSFGLLNPDWVVVLGDRIEAFAAASAASVGGYALAHLHGGDRAEGVADEAMRHAITKLAHLHLPATEASATRVRAMGERPEHVHAIGSPAIDGLDAMDPLSDESFAELGGPESIVLLHPVGRHAEEEEHTASVVLDAVQTDGKPSLALMPNLDPGRHGIARALDSARDAGTLRVAEHLDRARFVGLLKRVASAGGVLVGNSSAALIEAAALGVAAVDIGPRQAGRETAGNVVHTPGESAGSVLDAIDRARSLDLASLPHPYGDGHAGERAAAALADVNPREPSLLRKRCAY